MRQPSPERSDPRSRLGVRESREVFERSHAVAATNINSVVLTGNLTRDPELRSLPSGMSVCSLRIASNTRRKDHVRRVGGQAELLRRDGLGRPGRELRALPQPRAARSRSTAASSGASGRRRTARSARASRSSPTPSSSSAAATTGQGGGGNGFTPQSDVPVNNSDFQPAGAPAGGGSSARRTTTSPSRGRRATPGPGAARAGAAGAPCASATMRRPRPARGDFVRPTGAP